ncbi:ABC transporter substrate-binding protein [Phytohabitans sp. ZYX-F-186]|uniref:ABC transporter substrate-binding protein n=1 Tax=Phytohabitans maris TaxID=3071409 RepID=A0ABU0ZRP7_9ACTN|nr:ABC transporter substrate-binding protein [Phytohabitans sp. ZYX-F-186]MDQ7909009.1 ABC transporter substrate-binding protein [Phytohabitans sp. ZYX-F-186]
MRTRFTTRALLPAAVLSVALAAAGCAGSTPSSTADKIRVGVVGLDFSNIDPGVGFARQVDAFMLETLMKLSPTGEVEPNLAESVEQTDDVTYVYHLRDDVKFSSGRALTAEDVVASINYERKPEFSESFRYSDIADVKARDDQTVVVTLKAPTASFQYVFALNGYIFDAQHQSKNAKDFGKPGTGVIGTGPYVLDELDSTNGKATFTANPDYWGGQPKIATATLQGFADENSEALAFRTGELDVVFPSDVRSFEATAGTKVTSVPGTRQGIFWMNVGVAPWNDVHVRRAVAYAINKDDIINVIGGNAVADSTLIPPAQLLSIASQQEVDALIGSLPTYNFDLDKAKGELSQSAYPQGFSAELKTPSYGGYVETAQAIAGQLKKLGIDITVTVQSEAQYENTFSKPHSEVPISYTYFNNRTPDPGGMPRLALHSSATAVGQNNFADYVNPKVDDLIHKADATTDAAKRFGYYSELLKIVGEDVPYVPLYAGNINVALSGAFEWKDFSAFSSDVTPYILQISPK